MKNKIGQINNIIYLIFFLFLLMLIGMGMVFGGVIIEWVFDESVPELSTLGVVGNTNLTEISDYTLTPLNNVVQSFKWLSGGIYLLALVGLIGLSVSFRMTGNKWLAGFFIVCMLMLIITSIFISNIYEEFYNDGSDIGERLHENILLSFLLLYSPLIMTIIGFICGIIMFTGEDSGGYA